MTTRIALLVPEYRTEVSPGGGVDTVVDFIYSAYSSEPSWEVEIISPRMWRNAPEHQLLRKPKSWLKGPTTTKKFLKGKKVTYVGARFAEFEILKNLPRPSLNQILEPFDVIVAISGTPAFLNSLKGIHKPVVSQVATTMQLERARLITQGNPIRRLYNTLSRFLMYQADKQGIRLPDVVLVENPWMEKWSCENGATNVKLEIPGVDTDFFSPKENLGEKESSDGSRYIVSVGRLGEVRKDFGLLIRSYHKAVKEHGINQKLVLAGRGDLSSEVYEEIHRLNLSSRVEVRSDLSFDALRDCYRDADLFAMSSSEEGLGLVLIESLACGTPFVSTATEGAKSVVSAAGAGTLVNLDAQTEESLAQAIADLANNDELLSTESKKARTAAVEKFNLEDTEHNFREVINNLLT